MIMPLFSRQTGPSALGLAGAGVELAGTVAILALLGWWLDDKWGTRPWLMVAGLFIGTVGAIYNLWRIGKRFFKS